MTLTGKTVLVTGASGFVGGALALGLAAEGTNVRALVHSPGKGAFLANREKIEMIRGDICDVDGMTRLAEGCDCIFHVAALVGSTTKNGDLAYFRKINVEGTRNVLQAAVAGKVRRIVYVSTILVYGYPHVTEITEDMPLHPGSDSYSISKAEGEALLVELASRHQLSYTVIRPGAIYGPGGQQWTGRAYKMARNRPLLWIGNGQGASHTIYIDDLVDLMILASVHDGAHNQVFNAVCDPSPTMRTYMGSYSKLAGHQMWVGIPPSLVSWLAPAIASFAKKNSILKDLPVIVKWLAGYRNYKMNKARELLSWQPTVDLETGIRQCIPWLKEQGLLK